MTVRELSVLIFVLGMIAGLEIIYVSEYRGQVRYVSPISNPSPCNIKTQTTSKNQNRE